MLNSMWIAISTYSRLPAPQIQWREDHMGRAILFLPMIGLFIGGALLLWQWVCLAIKADVAVFAAVATVLPLFITGGIHMDGFMDTSDALASYQPKERKLEIMKDSHTGAFAVMWCAVYLLLSFSMYWVLYQTVALRVIALGFILSRALCVLSALTLPNARKNGFLCAFTTHAKNRFAIAAMCILSVICLLVMTFLVLLPGLFGFAIAVATVLWYRRMAIKQFGGATGDTSGYFIHLCELCMLFGVWGGGVLR